MQSTQHFTYVAPSTWALLYIVWSLSSGACRWRSRWHEFPPCRSVLSNGLVRGRCGADGQRTDDDCERVGTEVAAPYESVSHHWWRILTNGHWESVWGTKCPVRRSSLIISQLPTMSLRHIGMSAEYICVIEAQLGFHCDTGLPYILIQCEHCLMNYVYSPLDLWLTAAWDVDKRTEVRKRFDNFHLVSSNRGILQLV